MTIQTPTEDSLLCVHIITESRTYTSETDGVYLDFVSSILLHLLLLTMILMIDSLGGWLNAPQVIREEKIFSVDLVTTKPVEPPTNMLPGKELLDYKDDIKPSSYNKPLEALAQTNQELAPLSDDIQVDDRQNNIIRYERILSKWAYDNIYHVTKIIYGGSKSKVVLRITIVPPDKVVFFDVDEKSDNDALNDAIGKLIKNMKHVPPVEGMLALEKELEFLIPIYF
jgi:hypothetical protein